MSHRWVFAAIYVAIGLDLVRAPAVAGRIYWIEAFAQKIQRADLNGMNRQDLLHTGGSAVGIALDLVEGKVYWTGDNPRIGRANLDGSNIEVLIPQAANPTFIGIALDLINRKMYWVDVSPVPRIWRANLDGTSIEAVIEGGMSQPRGIALDAKAGKVYWTDIGTNDVRRANLDGTSVEVLVDFPVVIEPISIALDLLDRIMYWGDQARDKIQRANLDGSEVEDVILVSANQVWGIALDPVFRKLYWTNNNQILRANQDGSDIEQIVSSGLFSPRGIALEPTTGIPAISPWGAAALALSLAGIGATLARRRRENLYSARAS